MTDERTPDQELNAPTDPLQTPSGSYPFLRYFAEHPTAANLLMLIFLFLGFLALPKLQRETFPDFAADKVEISVPYPGASAEDVETGVCMRVEDALDAISEVKEVTSEAREGSARIVAEMVDGANLNRFLTDVKTEVEAIDDFPDQAETPVIKELNRTDLVCQVAVTGPMSVPDLKLYCEDFKDRLLRATNVSQVDVLGFSDHQIRIHLSAMALQQYGLSASDVADIISQQSLDLPAGVLETAERDILVRFDDERRTVQELRDLIVVASPTGAELRLDDIAEITNRFELDEDKVLFDGQRAGILQINMTDDQDALDLVAELETFLDKERRRAPPTVTMTITQNISDIVQDRLTMLTRNGWQGLLLVFLAMWLFFDLRMSFWVAMGLPVSFMAAFFAMQQIGFSLNMLTMVGLLLALGLLMDDAIVIAENVAGHLSKGKSAVDAAVEGTAEVGVGVFSSFLTTLIVFGSVALFIEGEIGKVLWVMPVVLLLVLSVSLVEAFLILPNHMGHSLKHVSEDGRFRRWFNARLAWTRENVLGRVVDWAVSWRYLVVGLSVAALLMSMGMLASGKLKRVAFPDIDGDVLQARILLPQGTPLSRTEMLVARVASALESVNQELTPQQPVYKKGEKQGQHMQLVQHVNIRFNTNADANEQGPHVATVTADLLKAEIRNTNLDEFASRWRETVGRPGDVLSLTYKEPQIGPGGLPIDIRLRGPDLEELKSASRELVNWLGQYEGVVDLMDDLRPGKPEYRIRLKEGATSLGLSAMTIASQLRAAFHGSTASEFQFGDESYEVDVQLTPRDQDSLQDLHSFRVTLPDGGQAPLGVVATLTPARGWATITRVDGVRTVNIKGDVDMDIANANEIVADTTASFMPDLLERHPSVSFSLEGQASEGARTGQSLMKAFAVGVFGVFVLLSFQFKSYVEPLIVMSAIPMALVGVIWGHLLLGLDLSMPSIMGFVSLAGVVVNDSILLVTFIKMRRADGNDSGDAATLASRERFRAVLLTSITTIVGLLPLLSERSLQAQILIPLAASIVFGLLASTLLVLIVIPCLYTIFDDIGLTRRIRSH